MLSHFIYFLHVFQTAYHCGGTFRFHDLEHPSTFAETHWVANIGEVLADVFMFYYFSFHHSLTTAVACVLHALFHFLIFLGSLSPSFHDSMVKTTLERIKKFNPSLEAAIYFDFICHCIMLFTSTKALLLLAGYATTGALFASSTGIAAIYMLKFH
jgi:hypothetical protein